MQTHTDPQLFEAASWALSLPIFPPFRLRHPSQSDDSSLVSFSHNQNSNGSTTVVFKAIYSWTTLSESANHVYSVLFTSHNKVWILSQFNYSSRSSPYQLLIGRVFWNRMTRLVLLMKSIFQMCTKKNVSTASTENQVICSTDTAVIQKRQVAGSVYWFRYFYANSVELFYTNLVILYVHEFAVILLYQQGNGFTGEVADCHILASYWFLFLFWYSGKLWHL